MFGFGPVGYGAYGDGGAQATSGEVVLSLDANAVGATLALGVVIQEHVLTLATNSVGATLPNVFLGFNNVTIVLSSSRTVKFDGERRVLKFDGENRGVQFAGESRVVILGGESRVVNFSGENRQVRF